MPQTIGHVIVLMLENRSFDHMLGYLKSSTYGVEGLSGTESNPLSADDPTEVPVTPNAEDKIRADPGHSLRDTNVQVYFSESGPPLPPGRRANSGFVENYSDARGVTTETAPRVMDCFSPQRLPVLAGLARTFAVCDHWFASVPGPTWPNRFFVHAATSKGAVSNSGRNYDMRSIFESLHESGHSWKIYSHDFPLTQLLWRISAVEFSDNWDSFGGFKRDARAGSLPRYSFIEPKYTTLFGGANDQHPPHSIQAGEQLIDDVYNAVRTSPLWNDSLLVILYDEHGGFYDHVLPPSTCPPACAPDEHTSRFGFDRLGVRVPAVLVSPFIPEGTIEKRVFDHSSVPASLKSIFRLPAFLTQRDRHANTFEGVPSLQAPRTNTPERFGSPPSRPTDDWGDELVSPDAPLGTGLEISALPINEFQAGLVEAARQLPVDPELARTATLDAARPMLTEHDVAVYVRQAAERFRLRQKRLQLAGIRGVPGRTPERR